MARTDSLGAGLTKQIAYTTEPGDLGDQYNSFLDVEEVTTDTMSNGDVHDHSPLPIMLIGGASGRLGPGRHVKYPEHTPLANLLLTGLHKAEIPKESFGDSTGPIEI